MEKECEFKNRSLINQAYTLYIFSEKGAEDCGGAAFNRGRARSNLEESGEEKGHGQAAVPCGSVREAEGQRTLRAGIHAGTEKEGTCSCWVFREVEKEQEHCGDVHLERRDKDGD
ncbi:unnamed protein product [Meloidogyne enterolobii]|uniref:Uncharacterized protein n=1 Tax=Meloidogyne enterolobii TaxID=390850 RepID=A0ACB0Y4Y8_MELEN